jgi:hypothetical protein
MTTKTTLDLRTTPLHDWHVAHGARPVSRCLSSAEPSPRGSKLTE